MRFTVEIETQNSAFDDSKGHEVARILLDLAYRLQCSEPNGSFTLYDANGNRVGTAEFN